MISTRCAVSQDLKRLAALHRRSWIDSHGDIFPSWYVAERPYAFFHGLWEAFLGDDQRPTIVAYRGQDLLGFVRYGRIGAADSSRWQNHAEIHTLYVSPDGQGQGIGSSLLSLGEKNLAAAGSHAAILAVSKQRKSAIDFYRKRGWAEAEEYVAHYLGVQLPFLTMEKSLDGLCETNKPGAQFSMQV